MASFHLPLQSYEMLWLFMCCLSTTSTGQYCSPFSTDGSPEVRVSSTMHDGNWRSENPQPYLVEKGSDVTLTCTAKGPRAGYQFQPFEMNWFVNSTYLEMAGCTNGKPSPVKTCNLTLRWPDVRGMFTCQAANNMGCTYRELELNVTDGRKPTIIKAPVNQSAHIVIVICVVSGDSAPAINWTKDGNLLPFNQKVLEIKRVRMEDVGKYPCVANNSMGTEKSRTTALSLVPDGASITDKDDLLGEIQMLKQAGWHPNIVALIGACTQEEEILVVTELIPNGCLEKFLKSKRMVGVPGEASTYENVHFGLNDRELLVIAYQIALGMRHLEEKKCIHRDLSARNVFIGENLVAKVGDFGLARDISSDGIYTKTYPGKVPWRWMALESLKYHVYTSKSDVWSYGIVLWEIATYGEVPYPNIIMLADLISWLSMGNRMPRPEHSSDELYEMMRLCWLENPLMRPTFAEITKRFQYYLQEYRRKYVNVTDDGLEKDPEVSLLDGISLTKTMTV